jgi:uncharacterized membrane protein HdeD (DUF308 family)
VTDSREDTVTYAEEVDETTGRSPGRVILAVVLVIIGILGIIAGIIYLTTDAHSLPSVLGTIKYNGHNHSRAYNPRTLRGAVSLVVGIVVLLAGLFAFFWKGRKDRRS